MSDLQQTQKTFLDFLTGENQPNTKLKGLITEGGNIDRDTRLNIYGNAYRLRLRESIDTDHPILGLYLGDDLFDLMVAGYVLSNPSRFRSLRHFCDGLPDYLSQTEPFSATPLLAELAAFERRLLNAFDAADSQHITQQDLVNLPVEQWPRLQLRFHPSLQLFHAAWNSVESWQALKQDQAPAPSAEQNSVWLLWRNQERLTEFRSLPADEYSMLTGFLDGGNFAQICERLLKWHNPDQASIQAVQHMQSWLNSGLVARIDIQPST